MKILSDGLTSNPVILFAWAALAIAGIIWCLFALSRPKTNNVCLIGLILFLAGWLSECLAHTLVSMSRLPPSVVAWGAGIATVCFVSGLITALVGVLMNSGNEHRYQYGLMPGLLALVLNGWVVVRAGSAWMDGGSAALARGMIVPLVSAEKSLQLGGAGAKNAPLEPEAGTSRDRASKFSSDLASELAEIIQTQGGQDWRRAPIEDSGLLQAIHPGAQFMFFSPTGPTGMSLSLTHLPGVKTSQLPALSEDAAARVLQPAADHSRTGAARNVVSGFETSRLRYVAVLPVLAGPHRFDHWMAVGGEWILESVLWSPSTSGLVSADRTPMILETMLRVAAQHGCAGKPRPTRAQEFFDQGRESIAGGETARALELWMRASGLAPGDPEIALAVVHAHRRLKQPEEALAFLEAQPAYGSADPVVEAAKLVLSTSLSRPDAVAGFQPLFDTGFSDDSVFAAWLGALHAASDFPKLAAALEAVGPRHSAVLVREWQKKAAVGLAAAAAVRQAGFAPADQPEPAETPAASPARAAGAVEPSPRSQRNRKR